MNKVGIICSFHLLTIKYHRECLNSILTQTDKSFVFIMFDDGVGISEPKSHEINIIYRKVKNISPGKIKELGIKEAHKLDCEYVSFIDSDDVVKRNRIERIYDYIKKYQCKTFIHNLDIINEDGNIIRNKIFNFEKNELDFGFFIDKNVAGFGNTVYYVRDLLDLMPFPESIVALDWYLISILASKKDIAILDDPLIEYRQHENNLIGLNSYDKKKLEIIISIRDIHYKSLIEHFNTFKNYKIFKLLSKEYNIWKVKKDYIINNKEEYIKILNKNRRNLLWNQII